MKYGLYGGMALGMPGSLLLGGCGRMRGARAPNILLISVDTLRRDHCSVYGYRRDTTPSFRALAGGGAKFDLAYAPTSTTAPSHASMFTSLYPITHRVIKNGLKLNEKHVTLSEILRENGYQTAGVVSSFVLDAKFGCARGFDSWDDRFVTAESKMGSVKTWESFRIDGAFERRASFTSARVLGWLKKRRDEKAPFFMFVHYFDPHDPYNPVQPFNGLFTKGMPVGFMMRTVGLYDGEIATVDAEVGRLLAELAAMGLDENTVVIITADHGEGLMDHGHMYHGVHIYEEQVRVPLLFRWPGRIPGGRTIGGPAELTDLAPTILDLIGIDPAGMPFPGKSLAPSLLGGAPMDPARPVFLYRRHYDGGTHGTIYVKGEKFSVVAGSWKYIDGPEEETRELFDLARDPGEKTNLYHGRPAKAAEMADLLEKWRKTYTAKDSGDNAVDPKDIERLRSLGYIQ